MKYYIILIFILLLGLLWLKQVRSLPDDWQEYSDSIDADFRGYDMLEKLCIDIGGRISGSAKGVEAEKYVTDLLKSFNYEKILNDRFRHIGWERLACTLDLKPALKRKIKALSLGMTPAESNIKSELVYVKFGLPEDYKKISAGKVKGKIVLIDMEFIVGQENYHRADKIRVAEKNGAIGVILFNQSVGNVISTGTASFRGISKIPAICISREDGLAIKELIQTKKTVDAEINVENKIYETESTNISVELDGNEINDEIVLISAHLDAWDIGQGAIDNGSSVAILLEIARQFKKQNIKTRRKIRFTFFMAEEFGLRGSYHFVNSNEELIKNLFYVMNLEMILAPKGINLLLDAGDREWFVSLLERLNSLGMQKQVVNNPWLESDHTPFMLEGIPSLIFLENTNHYVTKTYHSNQDIINLISSEEIKTCTKAIGLVLLELANTKDLKKRRMSQSDIHKKLVDTGIYEKLVLRELIN